MKQRSCTSLMFSPTQMYQSKLFENEKTLRGRRWYGGSVHFHYVSSASSVEAYNGSKMVHSTMTEMISNVCELVLSVRRQSRSF